MSEKYYVVSASELTNLITVVSEGGTDNEWIEAEAACRAREVESIGGGMWQPADCAFEEDDV